MGNKILPYNCPFTMEWFENFNNIQSYFTNTGGIASKILAESGLEELNFFGVFDSQIWMDEEQIEKNLSFSRIIALEVYIDLKNDNNLEKAYLFHSHTSDYYSIYKDGVIKRGNLVLKRDKVLKWAELGYSCILCRDISKEEKLYEEYISIFKNKFSCRNIKPWKMNQVVASRGYKEVFLVLDYASFGDYFFEVDFYAIDTCFELIKKEKYIRDNVNPYFRIDNVDRMDFDVIKLLEQELEDIFLREMGYDLSLFSETYRDLAYLTAYLKYHYPDISDLIMGKVLEKSKTDSLGIALSSEYILGAKGLENGSIDILYNPNSYGSITSVIYGMDIEDRTRFEGRFSLINAGIALSEIGVSIRELLKISSYEKTDCVVISLPAYVPNKEAIANYMKQKSNADAEIYNELNLDDADAIDIVHMAAEMAGLINYKVVSKVIAIAEAYNNSDNLGKKLEEGQFAFVYDWEEDFFCAAVIQKKDGNLHILWQEVIESPAISEDPYVADGKTLSENVKNIIHDVMYQQEKMLKSKNLTTDNKESWEKLYSVTDRVIEQLKCDKEGSLVLENDWTSVKGVLECDTFAAVFEPYYSKTERLLEKILSRLEITEKNISSVYVSGAWGNYSDILKRLERFFGPNKICVLGDAKRASVTGAAYLAKKMR